MSRKIQLAMIKAFNEANKDALFTTEEINELLLNSGYTGKNRGQLISMLAQQNQDRSDQEARNMAGEAERDVDQRDIKVELSKRNAWLIQRAIDSL